MRNQNLFNEKQKTIWNCSKDVVMYNYQDYNFCTVDDHKKLSNR